MARTFILAWVMAVLGLIMFLWGIAGAFEQYRQTERAPSYMGAVAMICGGVAMWGVAQVLRLELFLIAMHGH